MKLGSLVLIIIALALGGCSQTMQISPMKDLSLPQNASYYVQNDDENTTNQSRFKNLLKEEYLNKYFYVWKNNFKPIKAEEMFWGLGVKKGFGESKRKLKDEFLKELEKNMQVDSYPSMKQKAIMIKTTNVRLMPTIKPRYSTIDGYPFDRWQNSLIFAYTPIIVLHIDKTKKWYLVQSSFVSGWVKHDEIAFLNDVGVRDALNQRRFLVPNRDYIPLYDGEGNFVENARIGMIFEAKSANEIYIYKSDKNKKAIKTLIKVDSRDFNNFPMKINNANIARTIDSLNLENYGWGGMYGNRDCSSFVRDIFMNFGVWLPRNSKAQVNYSGKNYGKYMELPEDRDEKVNFIIRNATPFKTILWQNGHIMLYIGNINNRILVVHDIWGVSTSQGFEVLGGISITTLEPGKEKNDTNDAPLTLLDKIQAMNVLLN